MGLATVMGAQYYPESLVGRQRERGEKKEACPIIDTGICPQRPSGGLGGERYDREQQFWIWRLRWCIILGGIV